MTAAPDDRTALRRAMRARREGIPAAARIAAAQRVAHQLLQLPFAPSAGHVAGYWAVGGELPLHAWQLGLPPACTYCLPVLHDDGVLRFAPWRPGDPLSTNRHGIPEPDVPAADLLPAQAMALVVAPLVGFDARGNRLGMGGGWYDRTFAFRQRQAAPPWLVGAAFSQQRLDAIPTQPWDVALDAVCTELGAHFDTAPQ